MSMKTRRTAPLLFLLVLLALWPGAEQAPLCQDDRGGYVKSYLRGVYRILDENYLYPVKEGAVIAGALRAMKSACPAVAVPKTSTWADLDRSFDAAALGHPERVSPMGEAAIRGMVSSLGDPYSSFLSARELALVKGQLAGEAYVGIGVELAPSPRGLTIVAALEGGQALEAGLRCRDVITAVDGRRVAGLPFDEAANLLLGSEGAPVRLAVERGGKPLSVSLRRAQLAIPPVAMRMLDSRTVYLKVSIFSKNTFGEVRTALASTAARGADRVVMDLRNNPGGEFEAAIDVASLFVSGAPLVKVRAKGKADIVYYSRSRASLRAPLAIIGNGGTASSSEVVICALRHHKAALLVGEKTFGKGLIQSYYPLVGSTAIKLTTGKYLSPAGVDIHGRGIVPDAPVKAGAGDKAFIDAALKALDSLER